MKTNKEIRNEVYLFCKENGLLITDPLHKQIKKILLQFDKPPQIIVKQAPKPIKPKTEAQISKERANGTFYNSDFIQRN